MAHNCEVRDKKFTHLSSLRKHMRIHIKEKPFSCEVSHVKKFTCHYTIAEIRTEIGTGERNFNYTDCDK